MLGYNRLSRNAANGSPLTERRLCWFSGGAHPPAGGNGAHFQAESRNDHPDGFVETTPQAGHAESHVEGETGHTKHAVHDVLHEHGDHGAHEKKITLRSTKERIEKARTSMKHTNEKLEKLREVIESKMVTQDRAEHLHVLEENLKFLQTGLDKMDSWDRLLEHFHSWESGNMHPVEFVTRMRDYTDPGNERLVRTSLEHLYEQYPDIGKETDDSGHEFYGTQWDGLNASRKMEIGHGAGNDLLEFMNAYFDKLEPNLIDNEKYARSVESVANLGKDKDWQLPIKFLSVNEIVQGFQNVVEAFKSAGKEWTQLRVAGFSAQLGEIAKGLHLPFGDSAQQNLAAALNHKDDEVKDHYAKHLESDIVPLYEMIPSHHGPGFLERNKHDGNRFRGSLEYMAKKGWIYDIDIENETVMGHKLVPGKTVPATWTPVNIKEFLIHLDGANKSGQSAEKKRGYERVDRIASIKPGIEILRHEISDGNYWAVLGILNRLLEKAKDGETACWIATSIMGMLRNDPTARRYFPLDLLDRLGNEGLVHLANTNINFVIDRWKIRDWGDATWNDEKLAKEKFRETGNLGEIISDIEHEIEARQPPHAPPLSRETMERTVAKVMATQAVKLPGWTRGLSIFDPKFKYYRDRFREGGEGKAVDPAKTDDDFFNADSEMVMHGPHITDRILDVRSPSNLLNAEKGISFMGQLLRRNRQLAEAGLTADQKTFQKETQQSLHSVLLGAWNGDVSQNFHNKFKHSEGGNRFLIQALIEENLIDRNFIAGLNTKLAANLREQLGIPSTIATPSTKPPTPPAGTPGAAPANAA